MTKEVGPPPTHTGSARNPPHPTGPGSPEPPSSHPAGAPESNPPKPPEPLDPTYTQAFKHHSPPGKENPGSNDTTFDGGYESDMTFYHSAVGTLTTQYGINYATWNYRMNTQHYNTYAGEVVQILSVAVDDIEIRGQIATYEQMEHMFKYFARYMERATQGSGNTNYSEEPVHITYPARGWDFFIQPKEMLGFTYGVGVAAPEWTIRAAVYDINPALESDLKTALSYHMIQVTDAAGVANPTSSQLDDTFDLVGEIGFNPNNPFSNPFPEEGITGKVDPALLQKPYDDFGKYYNEIVKNFATNNYKSVLDKFGSVPAFGQPATPTTPTNTSGKGGKKGKSGSSGTGSSTPTH